MRRFQYPLFFATILLNILWSSPAKAQTGKGAIAGTVTDTGHDVLPSAPVKLDPGGHLCRNQCSG